MLQTSATFSLWMYLQGVITTFGPQCFKHFTFTQEYPSESSGVCFPLPFPLPFLFWGFKLGSCRTGVELALLCSFLDSVYRRHEVRHSSLLVRTKWLVFTKWVQIPCYDSGGYAIFGTYLDYVPLIVGKHFYTLYCPTHPQSLVLDTLLCIFLHRAFRPQQLALWGLLVCWQFECAIRS